MRYLAITLALLTLALMGGSTSSTASGAVTNAREPSDALTLSPTIASSILQVRSIVLTGHPGWIGNLAWSPDGKILASPARHYTAHDKTVRLWKPDGTLLSILSAHTAEVYALAW